jgi:hypothetical protein
MFNGDENLALYNAVLGPVFACKLNVTPATALKKTWQPTSSETIHYLPNRSRVDGILE